jgi:transcriptional regulator with XRE-family HTH domain
MNQAHRLGSNLKHYRKQEGLTQEAMAQRLGVTRARFAAYEEGRAEPSIALLFQLADLMGTTLDGLLQLDWASGQRRPTADVQGARLRVLSVAVDAAHEEERISIVPVQAAAGYLEGHRDADFLVHLPSFNLPVPELSAKKSYRLFQIRGDSMLPVPDKSYVIAEYVQDWRQLRDYQACVVVSRSEGVVYKRLRNFLEQGYVELRSDNPAYAPYRLPAEQVLEVWRGLGYISFQLPEPGQWQAPDVWQAALSDLRALMQEVRAKND